MLIIPLAVFENWETWRNRFFKNLALTIWEHLKYDCAIALKNLPHLVGDHLQNFGHIQRLSNSLGNNA